MASARPRSRDQGAGGFVNDLADHVECVLAALAERDEGDVGVFAAGRLADLVGIDAGGDDDVSHLGQDLGDEREPFPTFVGDQDAKVARPDDCTHRFFARALSQPGPPRLKRRRTSRSSFVR
jgi:hypothetical protein